MSVKDGRYYYGSTTDLKRRILEHKNGSVISTKNRLPVKLVYYEAYSTLQLARNRERQIKESSSARNTILKRID